MANLSSIVNVTVLLTATPPTQDGNTIPLIVGFSQRFPERVREYTTVADMVTDGFLVTDAEYLAASALTAQSPRPPRFKIGRRANLPSMTFVVTPTVANSRLYELTLTHASGVNTVSYTSDGTATAAEITGALKTAIDTLALSGVSTTSGATLTVTCTAGTWLGVKPENLGLLGVQQTHADPGIAADLDAILLEDPTWYGFSLTSNGNAEVVAAAGWAETNKRQFVALVHDTDAITTAAPGTDTAADLKAASYGYTVSAFHEDNAEFLDAAVLGSVYAYPPGSVTFKFKTLAGVEASPLTATHISRLDAKNCNHFVNYGVSSIFGEGVSADGTFADLTRDTDALVARIQADVYAVLSGNAKVPYTDAGIAKIAGAVLGALRFYEEEQLAGQGSFLVPGSSTVTAPKASSVSSTEKNARRLTLPFQATISGAIHKAILNGVLVV